MRREIIEWRDQWRGQPRTADKATVTMATVLGWAVHNALLTINVAAGINHLHSADKSDKVWEPHHWEALAGAPEHLQQALRLASMTGLRLGDLVRLDWAQISDKAIILTVNRRSIGTPYRRAKGTPLLRCWVVDAGRGFRAAGGVGRA